MTGSAGVGTGTGSGVGSGSRDRVGDRDGDDGGRAVTGVVGDDVADVVGAIGVAGGIPVAGQGRSRATRPDGAQAQNAGRDAGGRIGARPRHAHGPADDAARGLSRDCDGGRGVGGVDPDRDGVAVRRAPGAVYCPDEETERAIARDGEVITRRVAGIHPHRPPGCRRRRTGTWRPVDGLRRVQRVGPGRPVEDGRGDPGRSRALQPARGGRRRCACGPGRGDRHGHGHEDEAPRHVSLPSWTALSQRGQPSAGRVGLLAVSEDSPIGWSRPARRGYISSGALTPTRSSERASTWRVASHSASRDDRTRGSASSTGQSR